MSPGRRAEWAKVQGRFADIPFEERTEQMVRLLAQAIRREGAEPELKLLRKQAKTLAQEFAVLGIRCGSMTASELQECLTAAYPFHPLTAITLGRQLCRRFPDGRDNA